MSLHTQAAAEGIDLAGSCRVDPDALPDDDRYELWLAIDGESHQYLWTFLFDRTVPHCWIKSTRMTEVRP